MEAVVNKCLVVSQSPQNPQEAVRQVHNGTDVDKNDASDFGLLRGCSARLTAKRGLEEVFRKCPSWMSVTTLRSEGEQSTNN